MDETDWFRITFIGERDGDYFGDVFVWRPRFYRIGDEDGVKLFFYLLKFGDGFYFCNIAFCFLIGEI